MLLNFLLFIVLKLSKSLKSVPTEQASKKQKYNEQEQSESDTNSTGKSLYLLSKLFLTAFNSFFVYFIKTTSQLMMSQMNMKKTAQQWPEKSPKVSEPPYFYLKIYLESTVIINLKFF